MYALRTARSLTRLVLVCFALCLGAAVASPLLAPQSYELICSGAGVVKLLAKGGDGQPSGGHGASMDCPLCAPGGAPPVAATGLWALRVQPLAHATRPIPAAHIAALTTVPPPARGPPPASS